jgi:isocitrate lyase
MTGRADERGLRRHRAGVEADERIRTFQKDAAREAGIFHHLITLPTYHTAALAPTTSPSAISAKRGCWAT